MVILSEAIAFVTKLSAYDTASGSGFYTLSTSELIEEFNAKSVWQQRLRGKNIFF